MKVKAIKQHRYKGRVYRVGECYDIARPKDAKILIAIERVEPVPIEAVQEAPPKKKAKRKPKEKAIETPIEEGEDAKETIEDEPLV